MDKFDKFNLSDGMFGQFIFHFLFCYPYSESSIVNPQESSKLSQILLPVSTVEH